MKFSKAKETHLKMLNSKDFTKRIQDEDPSMLKNIPILRQINSMNYLTIESQAGRKSKGTSFNTGIPYVMNERAYLSGFVPSQIAEEFVKELNTTTSLCAVHIPTCSNLNISSALDIPITYHTDKNGTWIDTHMSMALPTEVIDNWKKQLHLDKQEKVTYIQCQDPKWNRHALASNGLFTKVLECLSNISK